MTPEPKRPRTRLPGQERKKLILRCAVTVFARSNFRAAKVAEIAREAGVSEAMLYKHFPSKKAIFLEVLEHMSRRILVFWEEIARQEPDALEVLRKMCLVYYERMVRHPQELKVQFQAVSEVDDEEIAKRLQKDHRSYLSFIRKVLRRGVKEGVIRPDVPVAAMAFLFNGGGIMMNMMRLLGFEKEFNQAVVKQLADYFVESIRA
jgi:AcrR family transcriptional regulator